MFGLKNFGLMGATLLLLTATSCRREEDPSAKNNKTYQPILVDPKDIFPAEFGMPPLPKDNPFTEEGIYLGRMLFYDPILSFDSSISCGSCHQQEFAFAEPRQFSKGIYGLMSHRNAPSLFNMAYSRKFFWDARVNTLRDLIFEPIQAHNEMAMTLPLLNERLKKVERYKDYFNKAFNSEPNLIDMSLALEQFLLSIVSNGSRFNKFFPGDNPQVMNQSELRGAFAFNGLVDFDANGKTKGADCFHCHGGELAQQQNPVMGGIANNGLDPVVTDKGFGAITNRDQDFGTFKTPSLLNIALTAPYMHDGRFNTLEEVIEHYSSGIRYENPSIHAQLAAHGGLQMNLSETQKADLVAYLKSMTDLEFIKNPKYSNPFVK
jgi:cytochrome c peroxidase